MYPICVDIILNLLFRGESYAYSEETCCEEVSREEAGCEETGRKKTGRKKSNKEELEKSARKRALFFCLPDSSCVKKFSQTQNRIVRKTTSSIENYRSFRTIFSRNTQSN